MKKSIAFRFNLTASLVVLVVLMVFGYYNYQTAAHQLERQQKNQLDAAVSRLKLSLPGAIWNFEEEQLKLIVGAEAVSTVIGGCFCIRWLDTAHWIGSR
jgi:hypothetical protein